MPQVAGEEGHLVGTDDEDARGLRDQVDGGLHVPSGDLAGGLLDVEVVGNDRRLELVLVEGEERLGGGAASLFPAGDATAVLLAGRGLELRESLEAERLGEADDR